jgi:hypothetical protein
MKCNLCESGKQKTAAVWVSRCTIGGQTLYVCPECYEQLESEEERIERGENCGHVFCKEDMEKIEA